MPGSVLESERGKGNKRGKNPCLLEEVAAKFATRGTVLSFISFIILVS